MSTPNGSTSHEPRRAVAVLGLRGAGVNPAIGVIEGLVLVLAYGLAVTLLAPYGSRGLVLTALAAFVLAGAGLLAARAALHTAAEAAPDLDHVEHRLHGAVVAAIIAVVVILAAGITAAVASRGPSTRPKPPNPSGLVPTTTHKAAAIHPGVVSGRVVLASTSTPLADGGTLVNFTDGVSATIAPGWRIAATGNTDVWADEVNGTAQIELGSGKPHAPDISGDLAWMINESITVLGYTNVVQQPSGDGVQAVQGKNFTQMLTVGYTADTQTNQGTVAVIGVWMDLFNPSTQLEGFVDLRANSQGDLNAAIPDAKNMIASML
jgi:hypothetical protein